MIYFDSLKNHCLTFYENYVNTAGSEQKNRKYNYNAILREELGDLDLKCIDCFIKYNLSYSEWPVMLDRDPFDRIMYFQDFATSKIRNLKPKDLAAIALAQKLIHEKSFGKFLSDYNLTTKLSPIITETDTYKSVTVSQYPNLEDEVLPILDNYFEYWREEYLEPCISLCDNAYFRTIPLEKYKSFITSTLYRIGYLTLMDNFMPGDLESFNLFKDFFNFFLNQRPELNETPTGQFLSKLITLPLEQMDYELRLFGYKYFYMFKTDKEQSSSCKLDELEYEQLIYNSDDSSIRKKLNAEFTDRISWYDDFLKLKGGPDRWYVERHSWLTAVQKAAN